MYKVIFNCWLVGGTPLLLLVHQSMANEHWELSDNFYAAQRVCNGYSIIIQSFSILPQNILEIMTDLVGQAGRLSGGSYNAEHFFVFFFATLIWLEHHRCPLLIVSLRPQIFEPIVFEIPDFTLPVILAFDLVHICSSIPKKQQFF